MTRFFVCSDFHGSGMEEYVQTLAEEFEANGIIYCGDNLPGMWKYKGQGIIENILNEGEEEKLGYERVGSKTLRNCLDKYQPKYWVCDHVHEARGEKKVGNTRVINPGSLFSGEYAVLDTNTGEVKFEQI